MTESLYLTAVFGGFSVLCMIPLICILDLKFREIPDKVWTWAAIPNIPALIVLYYNGLPFIYLGISTIFILIYLTLRYFRMFGGADAKFLMFISLFVVFNPLNVGQWMFQIWYFLILSVVMGAVSAFMWSTHYKKVPMTIPISIAYLIAIITGVI